MDTRTLIIVLLSLLLAAAIAVSGYFYWQLESKPGPIPVPEQIKIAQEKPQEADNSEQLNIFYLPPDYSQFIKETRISLRSTVVSERIRKALEELLNPQKIPSNLVVPIPEGTKLQNVFWSDTDGRVYISFSRELVDNAPGNALEEWATIYSIVNTVAAQSAAVKEVQILKEGEMITADHLNWDWSRPFLPDSTFVRYSTRSETAQQH